MELTEIKKNYRRIKKPIESRLREFALLGQTADDNTLFAELCFCLLTPQSKARSCWDAVCLLKKDGSLFCADPEVMAKTLIKRTRFHKTKSWHINRARKLFLKNGKMEIRRRLSAKKNALLIRKWLVTNVKGLGFKEASHFLRNIGMGKNLAILDRHVLKNLQGLKVISEIPDSLTEKRYLEIENRMRRFAEKIRIPLSHLDFVLWHKETEDIFK
ncbi:MAG: N-glycosylase/DNA lyase [Candidatus Aureabacteria bacterium]|nr:N-glycosylase/DNA lyase [Candidatus Auribacterota bacterium]